MHAAPDHAADPPPPARAPLPPPGTEPDAERVAAGVRLLATAFPGDVAPAVPLRERTTLHIGGPALGWCRLRTAEQARRFLETAGERQVPTACLGGGSNVLAADAGFLGCVLHVETTEFAVDGPVVRAGAGLPLDEVIARSLRAGLVGLEFASGIPGTLGGALVGNAGCFGHEIGEFVQSATLLSAGGRLEEVGPERFAFAYRRSSLQGSGDIVLAATLRLRRADAEAAWREREEKLELRRRKHPVAEPSAGSWFQNLPPDAPGGRRRAAGELLEQVGAKAWRVGDAAVFPGHANIIVNAGRATSADVLALVARMRGAVRERFGVTLVDEVWTLAERGFMPRGGETAGGETAT